MGLGNNSGKIIFVNIKKGMLAIKKDNEAHLFEYLEGMLTDLEIRDEEYQGEKYKKLCLKINDRGEDFLLQMRLDSGYGRAFCRIILNADLTKPMKIAPNFTEKDGKQAGGLFISQHGTPLKWHFTKDNPRDLPPMKEVIFKGKTVWDNTDQQEYFIRMLMERVRQNIIPASHAILNGPATDLDNIPEASQVTEPIDDLPF
jgi:hypothetical protein